MTQLEAAIASAYTGTLICDFPYFHQYVEKLMKRPVFTHELGNQKIATEIKRRAKPDFLKILPFEPSN